MSTSSSTRLDHFAWVVSPDNLDRYKNLLGELFGANLLRHPGPRSLGPESQIDISFKAGVELVAPAGDQTPMSRKYVAELATRGEFPTFCVMRVPDHQKAAERIEAAGYAVGENLLEPDEEKRRAFMGSWTEGVADMIERPIAVQLPGTALLLTELEFAEEPPSYVDRVGRLDRVSWLVEQGTIGERLALLETLFEIKFERDESLDDVEAYVSWEGGLELLTPHGTSTRQAAELTARLADRGEGLFSAAFAVADLGATVAKANELGLQPDDDVRRRAGADEAGLTEFVGMKLIASQPTGDRARVAA